MTATVYDQNASFFVDFVDRNLGSAHYNRLLAIIVERLGDRLTGARLCDLCCGEGYAGRHLLSHGAREVLGIDLSHSLIEEARRRAPAGAPLSYRVDDAQDLRTLEDGAFDIVVSQMAMMDVPDHRRLFAAVRRILKPGGAFVFSVLHPCFKARPFHVANSPEYLFDDSGAPEAVLVYRYAAEGHFNSGGTGVRGRMGSYHRMLASYINDLISAGFVLERIEEPLEPELGPLFAEVPNVLVVAAHAA